MALLQVYGRGVRGSVGVVAVDLEMADIVYADVTLSAGSTGEVCIATASLCVDEVSVPERLTNFHVWIVPEFLVATYLRHLLLRHLLPLVWHGPAMRRARLWR